MWGVGGWVRAGDTQFSPQHCLSSDAQIPAALPLTRVAQPRLACLQCQGAFYLPKAVICGSSCHPLAQPYREAESLQPSRTQERYFIFWSNSKQFGFALNSRRACLFWKANSKADSCCQTYLCFVICLEQKWLWKPRSVDAWFAQINVCTQRKL